jgi:hypothetical protein
VNTGGAKARRSVGRSALQADKVERAKHTHIRGTRLPVVTVPDLIVLELCAGSPQGDVAPKTPDAHASPLGARQQPIASAFASYASPDSLSE